MGFQNEREQQQFDKAWDRLVRTAGGFPAGLNTPFSQAFNAKKITQDTTLYVTSNGNDETGDGSTNAPYLTINTALESLRHTDIEALVTVSVGPGTFDGFYLGGFNFGCSSPTVGVVAGVDVQGTVTVLDSGSASASSASVLNDTTKSWTVDQFKGKFCEVFVGTSTVYAPILGNSATQLLLCTTNTPVTSGAYRIVDLATSISANCKSLGAPGGTGITPSQPGGTSSVVGLGPNTRQYVTNNIRVSFLNLLGGVILRQGIHFGFTGCRFSAINAISTGGCAYGACIFEVSTNTSCILLGVSGSSEAWASVASTWFRQIGATNGTGINISNSPTSGNVVSLSAVVFDNFTNAIAAGPVSGAAGQSVGATVTVSTVIARNCTVAANLTSPTVHMGCFLFGSSINMPSAGSATGNGTGFVVTRGAKVQIDANTISGATTDITYDGVSATLASMRAASPKLLTNTYGTLIYE